MLDPGGNVCDDPIACGGIITVGSKSSNSPVIMRQCWQLSSRLELNIDSLYITGPDLHVILIQITSKGEKRSMIKNALKHF